MTQGWCLRPLRKGCWDVSPAVVEQFSMRCPFPYPSSRTSPPQSSGVHPHTVVMGLPNQVSLWSSSKVTEPSSECWPWKCVSDQHSLSRKLLQVFVPAESPARGEGSEETLEMTGGSRELFCPHPGGTSFVWAFGAVVKPQIIQFKAPQQLDCQSCCQDTRGQPCWL